mgnify:CR=1 FL=1
MAKLEAIIDVHYILVIIPVARYQRVGDLAILTVLGLTVYQRVGDARSLLGFAWKSTNFE